MAQRIIDVRKASPIGDQVVPGAVITIQLEVPEFESLEETANLFEREAELIFRVLKDSLPGGTLHQLLIKLLENHVILLKVKL